MKTEIAYIYALLDPLTEEVRYIGKTVKPKTRLYSHLIESKNLKLSNHRLNWIRKLTSNNYKPIFKILKICKLSEFEFYEESFIKKYDFNILTNSDRTGQGNKGRKRSIIDKQSVKLSKIVFMYNINGELIKKFKSVRDAARSLNISHSNISKCCNGKFKHTSGFIFRYELCNVLPIKEPNAVKKSVIELDSNNNIINKWESIMECSRQTGIDNGNISKVCNKIRPHYKKRVFIFYNEV
jgi:hypothetical protein